MKPTDFLCRSALAFVITGGLATAQQTNTPTPGTSATQSTDTTKMDSSRNRTTTMESSGMMVGEPDAKFMKEAAMGGMLEVQAAQTAQQKASSAEVKELARKIEQDHTKANDELKALAMKKGVTLPTEMGPKHQAMLTKLQGTSGDQFDRTYLKMMRDDHKKDIAAFQKQTNRSMDSDVKAFAEKTLPVLQAHGQQVQQLQSNMSGKKSMSSNTTTTSGSATNPTR